MNETSIRICAVGKHISKDQRLAALASLQFIPLALTALTPTMINFVRVLPAGNGGAAKAGAVAFGRLTAHLILGIIFLFFVGQMPADAFNDRTKT